LSLKIQASGEAILDRDLFLNLGCVQNLSVDVSELLEKSKPVLILDDPQAVQEVSGGDGGLDPKLVVRPTSKSLSSMAPHQLGNPVTTYSPNHPRAVFLHDLNIGNAAWVCSCDGIG
jgi:hypothetical protein